MDRCLAKDRRTLQRRLYGRTKPGRLLKHHIPLKTDRWDVDAPGFTEIDLVSHSGDCAEGEFAHSLNVVDIHSAWVETRAVLGKSQVRVREGLETIREALPFVLCGIDSDNGSEFINAHLHQYCRTTGIQFTRGRPYKKDDNAHIEQKNWTHVRKLAGYERYDTDAAVEALNALYAEVRLLQNLFLPSVKLVARERVGARVRRRYDAPQTPLDRLLAGGTGDSAKVQALVRQRARLDPFALAARIDRQLERVYRLANRRVRPATVVRAARTAPPLEASPSLSRGAPRPLRGLGASRFRGPDRRSSTSLLGNPINGATIQRWVTLTFGVTEADPGSGPRRRSPSVRADDQVPVDGRDGGLRQRWRQLAQRDLDRLASAPACRRGPHDFAHHGVLNEGASVSGLTWHVGGTRPTPALRL